MSLPTFKVLFLCMGNSARSIFAESILNHLGAGNFAAFSAGSKPKGEIHPLAIKVLQDAGLPTAGLRSKSWDEHAAVDAEHFDLIFTVCDDVAGEACPVWPGHPITAHWGIADPVAAQGAEELKLRAFRTAFLELENRIRMLINLPLRSLDRLKIQEHVDTIGKGHRSE